MIKVKPAATSNAGTTRLNTVSEEAFTSSLEIRASPEKRLARLTKQHPFLHQFDSHNTNEGISNVSVISLQSHR
jgi:hypothetical protein